ncbi:OsmC family protein [Halobacterium bonnevillei]|uniref:OsmC family peroxiredoxin n=1 Tax=Halobacterium bonnevillei TaxID=2692200 RepID=A0A6B0SQ02_9EURY|nr:OsmC family protein [Halobacterium bonnevillei]MXR21042.1 OsmC family peroxiredoxin [Halobacterium bonnevillei]
MTIEVTSTSEEGYVTRSRVGDFELTVDATEEEGPSPNGTLLADYASCFIPAFRVGGQKEGFDDLGRVDIDVEGDLDDDDDLEAIRFHILVEADLEDDEFDAVVERAEGICHVHSALREELRAEITGETGAF